MVGSHGSGGFSGQFIKLTGCDTLVDPSADLLGDQDRVAVLHTQPIAQLLQPSSDLVEMHRFLPPIPFHNIHFLNDSPILSLTVYRSLCEEYCRTGLVHRGNDMKRRKPFTFCGAREADYIKREGFEKRGEND